MSDSEERVYCERVADAIVGVPSWQCRSDIRAALLRERAKVRESLQAEVDELKSELAARTELYNADLAGLQADRESLCSQLVFLQEAAFNVVNSECTWNMNDQFQFDATDRLRAALAKIAGPAVEPVPVCEYLAVCTEVVSK